MSHSDLDRVIELEMRIFTVPWDVRVFQHELDRRSGACYLVAEVEDVLVGYVGANLMGGEVHITNMAVDPGRRREGIATVLLLDLIDRCRDSGARWLTLEVRESNSAALTFYQNFGFRELGVRMGYYIDTGEHAVIMATGDILAPEYADRLAAIEERVSRRKGTA